MLVSVTRSAAYYGYVSTESTEKRHLQTGRTECLYHL